MNEYLTEKRIESNDIVDPLVLKSFQSIDAVRHLGSPEENSKLCIDQYMSGKTVLETLPSIITLPLTTYCNYNPPCLICDRNVRASESDSRIPRELVDAVRPLLKTAKMVHLHSGGEPLLSKQFEYMIDIIEAPTLINFSTNGMLLTERKSDLIVDKKTVCSMLISLDAAGPEQYRIMRPAGDFETVKKNIKYLTKKRDSTGQQIPLITLSMTVCQQNIADVPKLVDLAKEVGAGQVCYNHLNNGLEFTLSTIENREWDYKKQQQFDDPEFHDQMVLHAHQKAKSSNIAIVFVGNPFIGPEAGNIDKAILDDIYPPADITVTSPFHRPLRQSRPPCTKPFQEVTIQPDGDVRLCCYVDINRWKLGNVMESDFMEIWNSDFMIKERIHAYRESFASMCYASEPCYYREEN